MVQLTIDAESTTSLRRLVAQVCGAALEFTRIARCQDERRMRVWICVRTPMVNATLEAVAFRFPATEVIRVDALLHKEARVRVLS